MRVSITSPRVRPSPNDRRVGIRIRTFEACSGFTFVTAHRIAQQPKAAFVAGLRPSQLPGRAACQLPDQSTIIRVRPSLTDSSRPRGARSIASVWSDHGDFRTTPVNGHSQDRLACLKVCDASLVDATFPSCRQAPDVKKAKRADQQHGKPAGPTLSTTQLVENHRTRCRTSARRRGVRGSRPDQSAGRTGRDRSQLTFLNPQATFVLCRYCCKSHFAGTNEIS